jgi:hypothetical protein
MAAIPFLAAFICFGLVIFWYVQDEATRGGRGRSGFMRMSDGPGQNHKPSGGWKSGKRERPWHVTRGHVTRD